MGADIFELFEYLFDLLDQGSSQEPQITLGALFI